MRKFLLATSLFLFGVSSVQVAAFNDVDDSSLYKPSIDFLKEQGVVEGYSDGTFGYDLPINRAELLKIVLETRVMKTPGEIEEYSGVSCFDDIDGDEWFAKYICFAEAQEWIEGYGDGNFKPERDITFVEAVKILVKANGVAHYAPSHFEPGTPWYRGYVEAAAAANTIPYTIKAFDQVISRSEMADMVSRQWHSDNLKLSDLLNPDDYKALVHYESVDRGVDMTTLLGGFEGVMGQTVNWAQNYETGVYLGIVDYNSDPANFEFSQSIQDLVNKEGVNVLEAAPFRHGDKFYFSIYDTTVGSAGGKVYEYDHAADSLKTMYSYNDSDETWINDTFVEVVAFNEEGEVVILARKDVAEGFEYDQCDAPFVSEFIYLIDEGSDLQEDVVEDGDSGLIEYVPDEAFIADSLSWKFRCESI